MTTETPIHVPDTFPADWCDTTSDVDEHRPDDGEPVRLFIATRKRWRPLGERWISEPMPYAKAHRLLKLWRLGELQTLTMRLPNRSFVVLAREIKRMEIRR